MQLLLSAFFLDLSKDIPNIVLFYDSYKIYDHNLYKAKIINIERVLIEKNDTKK